MCYTGKNCRHQELLVSVSLTAARRALERLFWGCSAPGEEGAGNCFASHPMPALRWQESRGIAGGKERSPGLPLPMACSQCLAHFCSQESASPLSPAPSQGSRCKVLHPHVLPGSSCPIPTINSCPSWDTQDSRRIPAMLCGCMGRLRSPREPQRGRCPVLLPCPVRSRPVPGAASALHVLPPPPRRFRGRGLMGRGLGKGEASIGAWLCEYIRGPRYVGVAMQIRPILGTKYSLGGVVSRPWARPRRRRGGVADVRRCARALGARRRRQRGEGGRGWEKPGRERAEKLGINAGLELRNPQHPTLKEKKKGGKKPRQRRSKRAAAGSKGGGEEGAASR